MTATFPQHGFPQSAAVAAMPVGTHTGPAGTFAPGTKVQVGGHRVIVEKYLSEGGFAHVYLVRLPKPINGDDTAVLKRVAVPDKEALASMRTEVETMKKLKGHRHIVTYIDSHASQLKGGGYEVFLLMEYCNGGGLIDFMNTRLQNRLTEPEVLNIFVDVAQGVACMHYLKPPLLHRDLKVENVLIRVSGSSRRYKLCDFGSTAAPRPAATSAVEGRLIEEDVQKNTTLQYRSPEMVDVYRRQPIDEKSDIWALGVLLYKLCYYKTPFEEQGQMAILNASFKFPAYPSFSDRLKKLIASLLREQPQQRPNIYQVLKEVSFMRGSDVPIKDIYANRTASEARKNQQLPNPESNLKSPPLVAGAFKSPQVKEELTIPEITPMRRGRPQKPENDSRTPKPSPSPLRNSTDDPFSSLDSAKSKTADPQFDDVSTRFPALDDFSLLHDSGGKFAFDQKDSAAKRSSDQFNQRVAHALADEAFALPKSATATTIAPTKPATKYSSSVSNECSERKRESAIRESQPSEKPKMVDSSTMTSPPPSPPIAPHSSSSRPIFRVPPNSTEPRSVSSSRESRVSNTAGTSLRTDGSDSVRPGFLGHRSRSQILIPDTSLALGQPSEPSSRASLLGSVDNSVHRSKSANAKSRPSSIQGPSRTGLLRRLSRERSHESPTQSTDLLVSANTDHSDGGEEATKIDSNVEYLKAKEEEDSSKRKEKRLSSGSKHIKRSSMPSVSLSGTKNLLAGRFGEAFRRFESGNDEAEQDEPSLSPLPGDSGLTPIAGSEATDGRSDDGNLLEESEEVPPEVRRELERRRLSQEEKRVADAAAAYKQRVADGGDGVRPGPNKKAISIQSKVRSLLDESGRASPSPTKTAGGYGKYSDRAPSPTPSGPQAAASLPLRTSSRQPVSNLSSNEMSLPQQVHQPPNTILQASTGPVRSAAVPRPSTERPRGVPPSTAPSSTRTTGPPKPQPKPQALRTGDWPPQQLRKTAALPAQHSAPNKNPYQSAVSRPISNRQADATTTAPVPATATDWEANFSKRYPDLAGLELVETEIDGERPVGQARTGGNMGLGREMRVRDV